MVLITHGETVKDRGPLVPELASAIEEATAPGVHMGYCYSYGGIFFIDFFVWDGYPCLFKKGEGTFADSEVWKLDEENLAEYGKYGASQLTKPFFCRFPEGWVIVLVAVAGFLGLMFLGRDKDGEGGGDAVTGDATTSDDDGEEGEREPAAAAALDTRERSTEQT